MIATVFSFSLVNSTLVAKFTDINEFGSVAFAGEHKKDKAAKKAEKECMLKQNKKLVKKLIKLQRKLAKEAEKAAEKAS